MGHILVRAELAESKCPEQLLSEGYDDVLLRRALTALTFEDLSTAISITNS